LVAIAFALIAVAAEFAARWWLRYRDEYYVCPPGQRNREYPDPEEFPQL
jgi:hypothetical protein